MTLQLLRGRASDHGLLPMSEERRQRATRSHTQLAVGVAEVLLDGLAGDEERLSDLDIRHALGGHLSDTMLAGSQGLDPRETRAPGPNADGSQFEPGTLGERSCATSIGDIQPA